MGKQGWGKDSLNFYFRRVKIPKVEKFLIKGKDDRNIYTKRDG